MPKLMTLAAREVLDSRGRPTVEVEAWTSTGESGRAIVPSGASTGKPGEQLRLRDGDPARTAGSACSRLYQKSASRSQKRLAGMNVEDQPIDAAQQVAAPASTPGGSRAGANDPRHLAVATAHAAAASRGQPCMSTCLALLATDSAKATQADRRYVPMISMISGGLHAGHDHLDWKACCSCYIGTSAWRPRESAAGIPALTGRSLAKYGHESSLVADKGVTVGEWQKQPRRRVDPWRRRLSAGFRGLGKDVADRARRRRHALLRRPDGHLSPRLRQPAAAGLLGHAFAMLAHWVRSTRSSRSRTAWPRTTGTAGPP